MKLFNLAEFIIDKHRLIFNEELNFQPRVIPFIIVDNFNFIITIACLALIISDGRLF
ncbi:hypothetical protein [Lentisphaera araneosa]|uniref:hypothetical protein n=1 Tax=Lentisphaera araneosa TaxID=256847 RepID=UPI00031C1E60|nr:hypothetical protein [Lentisphaera araneosa]